MPERSYDVLAEGITALHEVKWAETRGVPPQDALAVCASISARMKLSHGYPAAKWYMLLKLPRHSRVYQFAWESSPRG